MATTPDYDVRLGDVGTLFRGEVKDRGVAFNPSGASITRIRFKTPAGTTIDRDGTVTTTGSGATQKWFLEYETVQADIDGGLHAARGVHSWQGYFEFSTGAKFHSDIQTYLVAANL